MFPAGHTLSITGGHADRTGYVPGIGELDPKHGTADGVDEVLQATRYQINMCQGRQDLCYGWRTLV